MNISRTRPSRFSLVNEFAAAAPDQARGHFLAKLTFETDPADLQADLEKARTDITVVDVRSAEAYESEHIPGAISLPHRQMNEDSTRVLDRERTIVTYCWGPGCNASTKGAARLAALGFRVKELIGGIEYWKREGYATEPITMASSDQAPRR
jgi:rhodanese-related sulfurtransferase